MRDITTLRRRRPVAVWAWGLYDFANTIFSMNIVTRYFALWVTVDRGAREITYSTAFSLSMVAVGLASPLLGALSDQVGRRLPFLFLSTLLCVLSTAFLGRTGLLTSLLLFALANGGFQAGLVFYDALLPAVSREENRGKVSGLGVALGYVGAIAGLVMVHPFVERGGNPAAFFPTAVLFLLFALPCFLFVREEKSPRPRSAAPLARPYLYALTHTVRTLRHSRRYPGLLRFLVSHFLYTDAVNTVILFLSVYAVKTVGLSPGEVDVLLVTATTFAVVGSLLCGRFVDTRGPRWSLNVALLLWMAVFLVAALVPHRLVFFGVACLAGVALGGTWTADRVYMLRLSPPEFLGEFYGLYGMMGRFSSIVGPMVWGVVVYALEGYGTLGQRIAVLTLLLMVLSGFWLLQKVSDQPSSRPVLAKFPGA